MALSKSRHYMLGLGKLTREVFYNLLSEVEARVTAVEADALSGEGIFTAYIPATAATTSISPACILAPAAGSVSECKFIPDGTVVQHDTNYLTLQLKDAAGNGMVTGINTKITGGSALAANTAITFAMDGTHKVMTANEVAEFSVAMTASGVAFPGGLLVMKFEKS